MEPLTFISVPLKATSNILQTDKVNDFSLFHTSAQSRVSILFYRVQDYPRKFMAGNICSLFCKSYKGRGPIVILPVSGRGDQPTFRTLSLQAYIPTFNANTSTTPRNKNENRNMEYLSRLRLWAFSLYDASDFVIGTASFSYQHENDTNTYRLYTHKHISKNGFSSISSI